MKNIYKIRKGRYMYKQKTIPHGPVIFEGNWLTANLFFILMPVKRDTYQLLRGDKVKKTKTIHGIRRYK